MRRELPRHVFNPPPRSHMSRLPPRQELPRNIPVNPAPPYYSNIPAAPPRSAAREQIAAVPRPALPFVPPRPISYAAGDAPPEYPEEARERGWQGRVVLHVEVSPAGLPQDVRVSASSGYDMLDQAALRAVRGWRFVPAMRGGVPVAGAVNVPVQFRLAE
jgi:protein TonB